MEAEYSPLSTLRVDDSPHLKVDAFIDAARELSRRPSPTRIRLSFILRTGVFILMELGFIMLASSAMMNPIPIHLSSNVTFVEAKGAVTIVSILWHTLAAVAAKDILLYIFSAEWIQQYRRSRSITFGETDSVSRLTAGYLDQIKHFSSRRATVSFRLAFISALLLIALNGLGPSAIATNYISHEFPLGIKVANLTLIDDTSEAAMHAIDRAGMITRLEQVENATYGFSSQQNNTLIPWPSLDSLPANTTIRYKSDVIKFNFNCSWTQPTISQPESDSGEVHWVVAGQDWFAYYPASVTLDQRTWLADGTILPLATLDEEVHLSLIPFIFMGRNTTISSGLVLNLEDIPALYIPDDLTPVPGSNGSTGEPLLVSVLLCDPQFTFFPATVTATGLTLEAVIHPGTPIIRNIPVQTANIIFSQSLLDALSNNEDMYTLITVNPIARVLFFANSSLELGLSPEGKKPLPIDEINNRMNKVLLSSAKAYLSGYSPQSRFFPVFDTMDADAVGEAQQPALVGSKLFLIALIAVVGVLVILLIILLVTMKMDQLQLFDLENIVKILQLH